MNKHIIKIVGNIARQQELSVYVVGGLIRDMLLGKDSEDTDFVVEGDMIPLVSRLQSLYGGEVVSFNSFGTARWTIRQEHFDFANARRESYTRSGAMPVVQASTIVHDLARRDFTINTLAIQISPVVGHIIDLFGGKDDLSAKIIRVLHDNSFIDDPTRIVRALRFRTRLGFEIEPHTVRLLVDALPLLQNALSGRLQKELTLYRDELRRAMF